MLGGAGVLKKTETRLGHLPTGVKEMLIIKLLINPLEAFDIYKDCETKYSEYQDLICNNRQLIEVLWKKFVSKDIPKDMDFDDLKTYYNDVINSYKNIPIETIINNEIYKKDDILYRNSKITLKLMKILKQNLSSNEDKIKNLIKKLVYVDQFRKNGANALMYAIHNGDLNIIKLLIDKGADVNIIDSQGDMPIFIAVFDNLDVVKLLVENGANINVKDRRNNTPLISACFHTNLDIVKYLIDKGADINAVNNDGDNALSKVSYRQLYTNDNDNDKAEIAKILILNGIDINHINKSGNTPLFVSLRYRNYPVFKVLIENGANIFTKNNDKKSSIMMAIDYDNNMDIIHYLINNGVDINAKDKFKNTVLVYAIGSNNYELVELLILKGANVNIYNIFGKTPLSIAYEKYKNTGNTNLDTKKIIELLIKHGAKSIYL